MRKTSTLLVASSLVLAGVAFAPPAAAASFTLTVRGDSVDAVIGDGICADAAGECSLRAAVQEANASAGADTITVPNLDNGSPYSLSLAGAGEDAAATGDLDVTGELTITGNAQGLDVEGLDRAFDVLDGASLTIDRLTLVNGAVVDESGGLVRNAGTAALSRLALGGSSATGDGASGGGVENLGALALDGVVFSSLSADRAGGGLEARAGSSTTIVNSVFTQNVATGTGDPMVNPGNGGGIHLTGDAVMTITDTLLTGNTAVEGGGIWNSASGSLDIVATDVSNNLATGDAADQGGGGLYNDGGSVSFFGGEIFSNRATGIESAGGAILNKGGTVVIDAAAVEEGTLINSNKASRAGGGIESAGGVLELRKATVAGNDTGIFDTTPGDGGAIHLDGTAVANVQDAFFENNFAIEGGGLWVAAGSTATVTDSTFNGNVAFAGAADQGGGAIYVETAGDSGGTATITASTLTNNQARGELGSGGAILNNNGTVTIVDSELNDNSSRRAGGAIEAVGGTTTITGSDLIGNDAGDGPGNGGAVHLGGAAVATVTGSEVRNNTAVEGGGLWVGADADLTVTNTLVDANTASGAAADQGGGGIYVETGADGAEGGTLSVIDSGILANRATGASGSGGGVLNNNGTVDVVNSVIDSNSASRAGGGVESVGGLTTISLSFVSDNAAGAAPGNGGGVHLTGSGTVEVADSTFSGNSANAGGGLWNSATGSMTVTGSTFSNNGKFNGAAGSVGGALYNDGGTLTVRTSTLDGNEADVGGGVYSVGGTTLVLESTITGNSGGVEGDGGVVTLGNSIVAGNTLRGVRFPDCSGSVASRGGNVTGPSCGISAAGDRTDVADPMLGELDDNGGATFTRLPMSDSPVIDAGLLTNASVTDQRGAARPAPGSALPDAGSVEFGALVAGPPVTPPGNGGGGGAGGGGAGSGGGGAGGNGGAVPPAKPATPTVAQPTFTG